MTWFWNQFAMYDSGNDSVFSILMSKIASLDNLLILQKKRSEIRINYRVNLRSNNNNFVHKSVQIRNRRRNSWWNGDEEDLFFTCVSEVKTSYKAFGGNIPAEFRKWYGPNTNMFDIASFVEFLFLLHNNQSIQRDLMSNYRLNLFFKRHICISLNRFLAHEIANKWQRFIDLHLKWCKSVEITREWRQHWPQTAGFSSSHLH